VYKAGTNGNISSNAACGACKAAVCGAINPWTVDTCNGLLRYKQCAEEKIKNETAIKKQLCSDIDDIETNEGIINFKAQTIEANFKNIKQYSLTSLGKYMNHISRKI
jgi:hypothetical protein